VPTINGLTMEFSYSGDGDDIVVLAAGSGMPPIVWSLSGVESGLHELGFATLTYAARGVANTGAPPAPYTIDELGSDLIALLDHVGIDRCHLVGYSLGGFVAEHLARTAPQRLHSAVLLASAGPLSPVLRILLEAGDELIRTIGALPVAFSRFEEVVTSLPPAALRDDARAVSDWWELSSAHDSSWSSPDGLLGQWGAATAWVRDPERHINLGAITVPTLVACFENDLLFPPALGRIAAEAIPEAAFTEIPDAAHGGLVTHTASMLTPLTAFLGRHRRGPRGGQP